MNKAKPTSSGTRVMRVSEQTYQQLNALRIPFAKHHKLKRCTYDQILAQALVVAESLLYAREVYAVGDRILPDLAEARGEAIREAVRSQSAPQWPDVLIALGKDNGLTK